MRVLFCLVAILGAAVSLFIGYFALMSIMLAASPGLAFMVNGVPLLACALVFFLCCILLVLVDISAQLQLTREQQQPRPQQHSSTPPPPPARLSPSVREGSPLVANPSERLARTGA